MKISNISCGDVLLQELSLKLWQIWGSIVDYFSMKSKVKGEMILPYNFKYHLNKQNLDCTWGLSFVYLDMLFKMFKLNC